MIKKTSVRFPSKLIYGQFKRIAKKEGLSMRQLLEQAIMLVVEKDKEKRKPKKTSPVAIESIQVSDPVLSQEQTIQN
ncbi:MAG: hypothetical protein WC445_04815 [Patescibacteria group bacterium]